MDHLDGNAMAGPLSELFRFDLTTTSGECAHCGDITVLARAVVYLDPNGYVVRCCVCGEVLLTLVTTSRGTIVDLSGVARLQIPEV